jgi:hypothetical protein
MALNLDARLTRAQAAAWIKVQPATLGMWVVRGHLTRGEDGRYRLGDVLRAEQATRYSPNNRGQRRPGARWTQMQAA